MPHRRMSIVLVALVCALPAHPEAARVLRDARRAAPPPARLDGSGDPLPPGALWRLGSLRLNAAGPVEFLAFTADGKNIVSAGAGSGLQVWDAATGRRRDLPALAKLEAEAPAPAAEEVVLPPLVPGGNPLPPPVPGVFMRAAAGLQGYSLTGRLLFAHDGQGTGHLIDTHGMRVLRSWPVTLDEARVHALTPDGSLFAWFAGKPGSISLVDPLGKGPPREMVLGGEGGFGPMAFSDDGKYLAVWEPAEKTVLLCLVKGGKRLRRYKADNVAFLGFGAGGKSLIVGANEGVGVYEVDSLEQKSKLDRGGANPIGFSWAARGKTLAVRYSDGVVHVWDVATGKSIREVTLQPPASLGFAADPDGLRVATASATGQIQLWDARTGKPTLPARAGKPILAAGFDASGKEVVAVHPGRVQRYAARDGRPGRAVEVELDPGARAVLSPSGDRLAVLAAGLSLIDTTSGKRREIVKEEPNTAVLQFAFLPDGRHALADRVNKPDIALIDLETGRRTAHFRVGQQVGAMIHVGKDGRTVYRTPGESGVERWEVATGKRRTTLDVSGQLLDISPDGQRIAVGAGSAVQIVELVSGRVILLPNAINAAWALSFSPDGEWFVCSGDPERGVTVWNARTGLLAARVRGHRGTMRAMEFSPTGKEFLTASDDGTLLVWDLAAVIREGRVVPPVVPPVRPMETLWADLASDDAAAADQAVREIVRSPGVAERFLARHLSPTVAVSPATLAGLLAGLDGDRAAARDLAEAGLAALGEQAVPALRKAEKEGPPEARRRAKRLLVRLEVFVRTGLQARPSRALEALELLGTPAAKRLLGTLAGGADASQTREAKASLERLRARATSEP